MSSRPRLSPKEGFPNRLDIAGGRSVRDAQHAPFGVSECLQALGLQDWIPRVLTFLSMFDGVARWMECGMPEAASLAHLDLLQEVQRRREQPGAGGHDQAALKFRLAVTLANSPITHFGARWTLERRYMELPMEIVWNPMEQPWLAFLERNIELPDHASLHISRKARQSRKQLIAFLLER